MKKQNVVVNIQALFSNYVTNVDTGITYDDWSTLDNTQRSDAIDEAVYQKLLVATNYEKDLTEYRIYSNDPEHSDSNGGYHPYETRTPAEALEAWAKECPGDVFIKMDVEPK